MRPAATPENATNPINLQMGGDLHLLVQASGSRLWRLAYRFGGRECTLSLGAYPTLGLADARELRDVARRKLTYGTDPATVESAPERSADPTFESLAQDWLAVWKVGKDRRIPAEHMKARREHIVPLSPPAVAVLRDVPKNLHRRAGIPDYVFCSSLTKTGAMSANTMIYGLYRMDFAGRQTVHGFRRLAST